ncbi:MAG: hypothetical protein C0621_10080 [Desulfuromonas sp.]|nr:MAG: hypothetical protein C0621_10080 [Desulfuromonas sp.]
MPQEYFLIIERFPAAGQALQTLIDALHQRFSLEPATLRQRLLGGGRALFARGAKEKLTEVVRTFSEHRRRSWLVAPTTPLFAPQPLRGLDVDERGLTLSSRSESFLLPPKGRLVAILADLSGAIIEKSIKRRVVQSTYLGVDQTTRFDQEEQIKTILLADPLLDLYLIDEKGQPSAAFRVIPGQFDPKGLKEKKTYSAVQNLRAVLELCREQCDNVELFTDFGLSRFPGCQSNQRTNDSSRPPTDTEKNLPSALTPHRATLRALNRFGWLMTDLVRSEREVEKDPGLAELFNPLLTAMAPGLLDNGVLSEVIGEFSDDTQPIQKEKPAPPPPLPPPPPRPTAPFWQRLGPEEMRHLPRVIGAAIGLAFFFAGSKFIGSRHLEHDIVANGLLPALAIIPLIAYAVTLLQIKTRVENTPTSRIRSLAMGMVEIKGKALRSYALVSPKSQSPCVWYRVRYYRRDQRGNWRITHRDESGPVPFLLRDATGTVSVNPEGAQIRVETRRSGKHEMLSILFSSALADDGQSKWEEDVFPEGSDLYVFGFADSRQQAGPSLRERTIAKLKALKEDRRELHKRFDRDGDGQIDDEEWQEARRTMEEEAAQDHLGERDPSLAQARRMVIRRPDRRSHPFVIAQTQSETHLTRSYLIKSALALVAALACAGWAIYRFLPRLLS